jgi:hypothetical protein
MPTYTTTAGAPDRGCWKCISQEREVADLRARLASEKDRGERLRNKFLGEMEGLQREIRLLREGALLHSRRVQELEDENLDLQIRMEEMTGIVRPMTHRALPRKLTLVGGKP